MTIKSNFGSGSYTFQDFNNEFKGLFSDGVCDGLTVGAHSPANLSVDVSIGSCIKAGIFVNSDNIVVVPITANTSGYNRKDIIVVDTSTNTIKAIVGTPSSTPTAPAPTATQLVLAEVAVGNNVSIINAGNITDKRANVFLNRPIQEGWNTLTLTNSWVNMGAGTPNAGFKKDALGIVRCTGGICNGNTAVGTAVATLPVGCRPAYTKTFACASNATGYVTAMKVSTSGDIIIYGNPSSDYISLDGIQFPAEQ